MPLYPLPLSRCARHRTVCWRSDMFLEAIDMSCVGFVRSCRESSPSSALLAQLPPLLRAFFGRLLSSRRAAP
eukprot:6762556-Alexandrium_andersonii.AAC.1